MGRTTIATLGFLLLAAPVSAEGAEDVVRAGCTVSMAAPDADGIAPVSADCRWSVGVEHVVAIVGDQAAMAEVLSTVSEIQHLPDGRIVQVHSMGWPIDDRQVTLVTSQQPLEGDAGVRISFRRADRQAPVAKGRVEIPVDEGSWEIRGTEGGGTHLHYTVRYDAGGNLTPWLARQFQQEGIAQSMEDVLRAAERRANGAGSS